MTAGIMMMTEKLTTPYVCRIMRSVLGRHLGQDAWDPEWSLGTLEITMLRVKSFMDLLAVDLVIQSPVDI